MQEAWVLSWEKQCLRPHDVFSIIYFSENWRFYIRLGLSSTGKQLKMIKHWYLRGRTGSKTDTRLMQSPDLKVIR